MKVTTERQENSIVKLTISVDEDRTNQLLRRAARTLSRDYRMPGFRPGKAPYNVVLRRLGIDTVRAQVLEQFGDQVFQEGLEESGLEPADQATLDEVTWDPFTLHLTLPVGPEVDLDEYAKIRIPWEEPQVTGDGLNEALLRMQREQKEWRPDDRPAEIGDQVVLDIKASVEGEVVLENTGRELVLDADSPFPVPGFAQQVIGMKPSETREFDLQYPEDHYNTEIAGKEGHFEVTLREIRVEVLPLLDDEFAMSVGDYESLEDLKTQLRQSLREQAKSQAEQEYEEQLWERLFEVVEVEYPPILVEQELDLAKSRLEQQLKQNNLDLTSYFQLTNTTEQAWREQIRPQAEENLKRRLILNKVVEDQNLEANEEEIEAEIESTVEPLGEQAEDMRQLLSSPVGRMTLARDLVAQKALERLKAIARGETEGEADAVTEGEGAEPVAEAEGVEPASSQEEEAQEAVPAEAVAAQDVLMTSGTDQGEETSGTLIGGSMPSSGNDAEEMPTEETGIDEPVSESSSENEPSRA